MQTSFFNNNRKNLSFCSDRMPFTGEFYSCILLYIMIQFTVILFTVIG